MKNRNYLKCTHFANITLVWTQALHLYCCHVMEQSQWQIRTHAQTEDHGQPHCHCVLGWDATRLSRLCHSTSVGQCLRLLQSLSQRAHKAMPYGLGQRHPHCPVCRELRRIKFYHLLSHSQLLINELTLFFPSPCFFFFCFFFEWPNISNAYLRFFLTTWSFFIYI